MKNIILIVTSIVLMTMSSFASANEVSDIFERNLPTQDEMGVMKCKLKSYEMIGSKLVFEYERSTPVTLVEDGDTFSFKYGINVTSGPMANVDASTGSTWSTNKGDVFHRLRENGKLKYVYESSFIKRVYIMSNCVKG